jgi:uncharacterized protein (DUF362 family)/ferredoxin
VENIFRDRQSSLPASAEASILIKPNFNNDLNSLMGNSTDLRLVAAVVESLQRRGYRNITIADGSNVGVLRRGIDVFERLRVDRLAHRYGVRLVNLNLEPSREVTLTKGIKARIAEICFRADCFISLPKIKTHFEARLTCACKNLVGCLAGRAAKKSLHRNLLPNLYALNKILRPHLFVVDGIVAMEGNGPGDGIPRHLGVVLAGTDSFSVDFVVARLINFGYNEIAYLEKAVREGEITAADVETVESLAPIADLLKPPPKTRLSRILSHPIFSMPKDILRPVHSAPAIMRLLYRMRLVQDVYDSAPDAVTGLRFDPRRCAKHGVCLEVCPFELPLNRPDFDFQDGRCMHCLYCYFACPEGAISLAGEPGFLAFQERKYGTAIRRLIPRRDSAGENRHLTQPKPPRETG